MSDCAACGHAKAHHVAGMALPKVGVCGSFRVRDELVWHRRGPGEDNWRARNAADDGTYVAYASPVAGAIRTYGVLLSDKGPDVEVYVGMGSTDVVRVVLQQHHSAAARAARWRDFMRDNEPPVPPTTGETP